MHESNAIQTDRPWYQQPLEKGSPSGCLNCPGKPRTLSSSAVMAVGFGFVEVRKDSECLWAGDDETMTVLRWTRRANKDPEHDWRIEYAAGLHGEIYQHQNRKWVLIDRNIGFA